MNESMQLSPLASYIVCMAFFLGGVAFGAWWYPGSSLRRRLSKTSPQPPVIVLPVESLPNLQNLKRIES